MHKSQMKKAHVFDAAILGVGQRSGQNDIVVYDQDKCIEILKREMSHEEALDFFDYNVLGAWVGEEEPIFVSCAKVGRWKRWSISGKHPKLDGIPSDD